jgi:NADPH2:quinone reductase
MRAVQIQSYGGPEVVEVVDMPKPEPTADQVLVRAHALGVGYPDVLLRTGIYKWKPALPTILGNEMTGHIEAVGANVTGLKEGQPVLVFGTGGGRYAEYNAVDPTLITVLPESVDLDAATTIPNYLVAWAALHGVAHADRAKTVYVNGAAGGTGTAILDLCRSDGIQTIAGASSDEKCAFAASLGTIGTVNYSRENIAEKVLEITAGRGVDISFDQLGGDALTNSLSMMAPLGLVVLYNALLGGPSEDLFTALREHRGRSLGVQCFSLHSYDNDLDERARIFDAIVERFASGTLNPPIYDTIPLEDARRAHELIDDRKILGKLILRP